MMYFWFFAALIGIPYYLMKYIGDKDASRKANREYEKLSEQNRREKAEWLSRVTDKDFEQELLLKLSSEETAKEFIDELSKSLDEMPWMLKDEFYEMFNFHIPGVLSPKEAFLKTFFLEKCKDERKLAGRIIMANRGKLLFHDADMGIYPDGFDSLKRYPEKQRKIIKETLQLVLWIDEQLRKHGVREDIILYGYGRQRLKDRDEATLTSLESYSGHYVWYPMLSVFERKNITDYTKLMTW